MARSHLVPLMTLLIAATWAASATARSNRESLAVAAVPPPPDLASAAVNNDTFVLPQEMDPRSPTQKCLERLTWDCATALDTVLVTKNLSSISRQCCRNAMVIGKTCWTLLVYAESDDPCHILRYIINHCAHEVNQKPFDVYEGVKSCDFEKVKEYKLIADSEGLV